MFSAVSRAGEGGRLCTSYLTLHGRHWPGQPAGTGRIQHAHCGINISTFDYTDSATYSVWVELGFFVLSFRTLMKFRSIILVCWRSWVTYKVNSSNLMSYVMKRRMYLQFIHVLQVWVKATVLGTGSHSYTETLYWQQLLFIKVRPQTGNCIERLEFNILHEINLTI